MECRKKTGSDTSSFFDKDQVVISMTDCTGLTQKAVINPEEVDSYTDIYNIPLTTNKTKAPENMPE